MSTAATLIRLRWALTRATLRKSPWQVVAFVIGVVIAVCVVVGTALGAWGVGSMSPMGATGPVLLENGDYRFLRLFSVFLGSIITFMTGFVQLMMLGEGSTMSPKRFALYGIPDRELQFGLLAAGLTGIPAITGVLSFMAWSLAYRGMGIGAVVAELVAAVFAVVTITSIAKLLISLATTLVTSKRGKSLFYIVILLLFVTICQIPNILVNSGVMDDLAPQARGQVAYAMASLLAWTPFGAAFQLPFDVATGAWGACLARLALLAATWVVCFAICTWCLRHERLKGDVAGATVTAKGIGAFGWMPDSRSGAVSARLFAYLKRDPRQAPLFAMPLFFLVIFTVQSHGIHEIVWGALVMSGWMMLVAESNGLSYDGRGFAMQVIAGVPGVTDRIGRVRVYVGIIVAYMTVLFVAAAIITGDWSSPSGLLAGLMFASVGVAVAFSGLGIAEVTSCALMYPVASMDKPFSSPQGRMVAQGFFPFVYMFGSLLAMLPSFIAWIALMATGAFYGLYWLMIPVSLANGIGVLALGTWLGGKLLDARMLSVMHTLDSFASLQR
ncbi:ABC transporter permease [Bifidobacterium aerophilum]|uniref:ABC transporter permease n=1 Tax=Bifidobacterium aerophilum TaxID=1798155 RepID=A0A6N9Z3H2_9BIFI|nr:ABC transporter permease [Bifidobacterium aerophilum]NEG88894.1 ABC transporter permease [Bifidobacterium aerophilum]